MSKLLLESFNAPLETISAELAKLEYETALFLLSLSSTYLGYWLFTF